MKLGSLFSGSGGFEFAAQQSGIEPVWASEIEPFPIAVTRKRFPNMKHLGDVSRINGAELEPVDIITFGSPCQSLSCAGKREGLKHTALGDDEITRSGLFMEAIRIIKEMREKTDGEYPTFAVWENVPGAFSSAGGEDFRAVLQAFVSIKDETANVPRPSDGKWNTAGEIVGDGYSVAWRVLDAQYWGVPQRRRRIFLVADFAGQRARRILFEREGLRRNFAESREAWQGITKSLAFRADAEQRTAYALQANGIDRADTAGCNGRGWSENVSYTLNTIDRHAVCAFACNQRDVVRILGDKAGAIQAQPGMKQQTFLAVFGKGTRPHSADEAQKWCVADIANCLNCNDVGESRANELVVEVYDARGNGNGLIAPTITGDHKNRITDYTAVVVGVDGYNAALTGEQSSTLGVNCVMSTGRNGVMCIRERCGCEGGGKGCLVQYDKSGTVATANDQFLCYAVGNGQADNSGLHEIPGALNCMHDQQAILCVALDRSAYNQGQNAQYDMGIDESGTAYTVVAKGPGAVCYSMQRSDEYQESDVASTQSARQFKSATDIVCYAVDAAICTGGNSTAQGKCWYADISPTLKAGGVHSTVYLIPAKIILRRLTPTECARLQGMPDWWVDGIENPNPTEEDMRFWREVFETHRRIVTGASKPKTDKQIRKWLASPHSDNAEYKMWGNGVALPCVMYVMEGIARERKETK